MQVTTMGIDLAEQVFQVHGIDEHGAGVLKKRFTRSTLHLFVANLPPCRGGMEFMVAPTIGADSSERTAMMSVS